MMPRPLPSFPATERDASQQPVEACVTPDAKITRTWSHDRQPVFGDLSSQAVDGTPKCRDGENQQLPDPRQASPLEDQTNSKQVACQELACTQSPQAAPVQAAQTDQASPIPLPGTKEQASPVPELAGTKEQASPVPERPVPELPGTKEQASHAPELSGTVPKLPGVKEQACHVPELPGTSKQASAVPELPGTIERASHAVELPDTYKQASAGPNLPDVTMQARPVEEPKLPTGHGTQAVRRTRSPSRCSCRSPSPESFIPSLDDENAPKPPPQECSLSPSAIDKRMRRVFTPRANGSFKVPERFVNQWRANKPGSRKSLEKILASCGYCPDYEGSCACQSLWCNHACTTISLTCP